MPDISEERLREIWPQREADEAWNEIINLIKILGLSETASDEIKAAVIRYGVAMMKQALKGG